MVKSAKKWALGAALAGIVGYVAGILTAPKSGKETRTDIKNAAVKAKAEAEKKLKAIHSDLNQLLGAAKEKAGDLTGKAKVDLGKAVDKAKAAKEKAREVLSALHEGDAEDPELKKAVSEGKAALDHLKKFVTKS